MKSGILLLCSAFEIRYGLPSSFREKNHNAILIYGLNISLHILAIYYWH